MMNKTTITTVGAWATKSALDDPAATVAGLLEAGANMCSIMLNDFRAADSSVPFVTHDPELVIALADACHAAGIEVSLTSWIMPYRQFLADAAAQLLPLLKATRSSLLIWDAEELWVRAPGGMSHDGAAELIEDLFGSTPMGLTAIVYANTDALSGLAQVCGTWLPQCYATTNDGSMKPESAVNVGLYTWRKKFGEPDAWIPGLAAYAQPTTPADYMQPCIDQAAAAGVGSVCYWSHGHIARRPDVAAFMAGIVATHDAGSVMPVLDIERLPSGTSAHPVGLVQSMLAWWGFDPGAIDGKPGANTLEAVLAFQRSRPRCTASGVVDGQTWWELLAS
jgi:hypothetical protein